jgi:hypothetical protein
MTSKTTTDLDEIREWAEANGGKPACIGGTGGDGDPGMLRLMFPDSRFANDENLHEMTWEDWGDAFEANELALIYEPENRFNKIVARSTAAAREHGESKASVHHPHGR